MTEKIDMMYPISGRHITEDGDVVNIADIIEKVYDPQTESIKTKTNLVVNDLQIGTIEIKDPTTEERAQVSPKGLHVDMVGRTAEVTFHTTATQAANGTPFAVGAYKTLTVEIYGTSSSRTVTFYGKSKSGTLRAIQGLRLSDFTLAASTVGTGEIWQFDVTGLDYVVMDLTAVAGGNVSVAGNAIA